MKADGLGGGVDRMGTSRLWRGRAQAQHADPCMVDL
jgi:hypothetical protein